MTKVVIAGIGQSNCASYALGTPPLAFVGYDGLIWNSRTLDVPDDYSITDWGTAFVNPADHARPFNVGTGTIAMVPAIVHKASVLDPAGRTFVGIMSPRGGKPFETDWWNASGRLPACLRFERILIAAGNPVVNVLYSQGWEASCNAGLDTESFKAWHKAMVSHLIAVGRLAADAAIILVGIHPNNQGSGDKVAWNAAMTELAGEYASTSLLKAIFVPIDPAHVALDPLPGGPHWDAPGVWFMATKVWQAMQTLGV